MPHLLISAPHKSSGKTTITLGLCAALARRGLHVQPFKKGPDYIDPMWLAAAAGRSCYNLDFNTQSPDELAQLFHTHNARAEISLIEGNMGLFDSIDVEGHHSNAALAQQLDAPVILVIDVRGATRSIVPLLLGFQAFAPELRIAGLILNKVAGTRHEKRLREVIAHYCDIPVIGAIHRDERLAIAERHLGLIPSNEEGEAERLLNTIAKVIEERIDLDLLIELARLAPEESELALEAPAAAARSPDVRIGIARDAAFGFYYPDDLEALEAAGAELLPFDTLHDSHLPEVDALFIGGGFPETQMEALEANTGMRSAILNAIEGGMPAYAECGGLMYLCRSIHWSGRQNKMVGIIPADVQMHEKPIGRGLMRLAEHEAAPWSFTTSAGPFAVHEFHYSTLENMATDAHYAYRVIRGHGIDGEHDGFVYKNLLAGYAHLRNTQASPWAEQFVTFVREQRERSTHQN